VSHRSPLHLYVHIPFCLHKCHYCDFNSHERAQPDWTAYREALCRELVHWAEHPAYRGRCLASIFFGGGTPSLAPPELIGAVVELAASRLPVEDDVEISLEANPGASDAARFAAFRQAGINRLSIGVQSLDDAQLRWLERIHSSHEALAAFDDARAAGFDNINLDLMYALPDQTLDGWLATLHAALRLAPEHLSCYQLTVEPHTRLAAAHARRPIALPDEELALTFFQATRRELEQGGYIAYEISNFARPGHHCRHNDGYWRYHDHIGIGAGACGKWTDEAGGSRRYANIRTPERYVRTVLESGCAIGSDETLKPDRAAAEAVWLGLRRRDGVLRKTFISRFGDPAWRQARERLRPWIEQGHVQLDGEGMRLTDAGLPLADAIAAEVL